MRLAEEFVRATHVLPFVRPGVAHKLHLAAEFVRRGVDDSAVAAETHRVILALRVFRRFPRLPGSPENGFVPLWDLKVGY